MNAVLNLGKYLYAIPFAVFGAFHFMNLEVMASWAPLGKAGVIIAGLGLIAAAVSMIIGKMDKLASVLLAVMLLLFVVLIHAKGAFSGDDAQEQARAMSNMLKDIMLAGAALMYAKTMAKDNAVIG